MAYDFEKFFSCIHIEVYNGAATMFFYGYGDINYLKIFNDFADTFFVKTADTNMR